MTRQHEPEPDGRPIVVFVSIWQKKVWTMEDGRREHKSITAARDWAHFQDRPIKVRFGLWKDK